MTTFLSYFKKQKLPSLKILSRVLKRPLSWYAVILYFLITATLLTIYILIIQLNNKLLTEVPARGGTIIEGMVGEPKFINPILAKNDTDIGLSELIFSGLMQIEEDQTLSPNLAETYSVSNDDLIYTFNLKKDLKWSDNKKLTSQDVLFTFNQLINPEINPNYQEWQNISIETPDTQTIIFRLTTPQPDFLSRLTVGILPAHIWSNLNLVSTAINKKTLVGSGPYKISQIIKKDNFIQRINLKRNDHFALQKSYVDKYKIVFFNNQEELLNAINHGQIDLTFVASAQTASQINNDNFIIQKSLTDAKIGLYTLRNNSIDQKLIDLLDLLIDKEKIIDKVEHGYGIELMVPTSSEKTPSQSKDLASAFQNIGYQYTNGLVEKNGSPVVLAIAVENDPDTFAAAQEFADELDRLGILTTVNAFDPGIFRDYLEKNNFQLFFSNVSGDDIPENYQSLLILYNKAYPLIIKKPIQISSPVYIHSSVPTRIHSEDWYIETDKIWRFLIKK